MRRRNANRALAAAAGLAVLWIGWGLYASATAPRIEYSRLWSLDGVEIRRYPRTVLAETTAADEREAVGRLSRYVSGENERGAEIETVASVRTRPARLELAAPAPGMRSAGGGEGEGEGESESESDGDERITVGFVLSTDQSGAWPSTGGESEGESETGIDVESGSESGIETGGESETESRTRGEFGVETETGPAPTPADRSVSLTVEPPRTLAVRPFSWYATDERLERARTELAERLETHGLETDGEPFLLQYDGPLTPPFLRSNEVAVELEWGGERGR